ncbi:MAG TPA: TIGR03617 family F420-dependent LLM class oxidoreductase [Chloroflexi bacterium]|nr:TIGR03617 family F420-dependent LLM class oxidoreductase [Chloroflexota bacterium]
MKIDAILNVQRPQEVPAIAQAAEALGFDGLWVPQTTHDPFLLLALAAQATRRIELGTAIALAFTRSPTEIAYTAWDLAALSEGRFILGLGTQVKAHIERRFGMPWEAPAPRLREVIEAIRAVWRCWQEGTRLNYRGRFYKLTLMSPFFNPGPIPHPRIPIYIAGTNRHLCRLAGELADGFHVHPYHSVRYLRERILPAIEEGLTRTGRRREEIALTSSIFVITGRDEEEMVRRREEVRAQIAFYASTPSYRPVLEVHGWGEVGEQLSRLAARQRWGEMPALISDEMLESFAVIAPPEALAEQVQARYQGLLDRVAYYLPFVPGQDDAFWRQTVEAFHR